MLLDHDTLSLARRQHGIVAAHQLSARGVTLSAIARARRAGVVIAVAPGVFRVTSSPETFESRCMTVALRLDGDGFLGGWTAGRLYGLRRMPSTPIHVTTPAHSRRDFPVWCEVHRSRWYHEDQIALHPDGLPIAEPLRMLFGLAAAFNQHRFERAAEDAWHLGLIDPLGAAEYLEQHRCRGKDGVARMERWLDKALGRDRATQSDLERGLLVALEGQGIPRPALQHPLRLPGGEVIHLDLAWPAIRLAVEPGASWWHGGDLAQRRDQERDRACSEVGWMVVRFDETMRLNLADSARQVARIYRRRLDDHSRRPVRLPSEPST